MKNPIEKVYIGNGDNLTVIEIYEIDQKTYSWKIIFLINRKKYSYSWEDAKKNNKIDWSELEQNFEMIADNLNYRSIEYAKQGALDFIISNFLNIDNIQKTIPTVS